MNKHTKKNIEPAEALNEAICALLKNNTIENIIVSDICEKAQVNRAVFYAYFSDKYALLDYINPERV